jgi:radical SAM protein with 4Fe4S-binding SPASM domain
MSRVPLPVVPDLPREIQIEVTGACNLRCHMCLVRYRPALPREGGSLSFASFRRIVDALPALSRVTLQGLGEPLLAPDLFAMIEHATARGVRVGFNTNATLLHRAAAERLVDARLSWLCVSIDGATAKTYESIRDGASFERLERNVRGLVDVMRQKRATLPDLSIVFVAMRRNVGELPDMVKLARDWGLPKLRVQNLSHSFDDTDPAGAYQEIREFSAAEALWQGKDDEAAAAFDEARRLAAELGVDLRLPSLDDEAAALARRSPGCDWPWRSAYVRHDGLVQPCCMVMGADRAIVGDAKEEGFEEVWRGARYAAFREGLIADDPPDVCRGCSAYRGVF